jgi:hypothetical protein
MFPDPKLILCVTINIKRKNNQEVIEEILHFIASSLYIYIYIYILCMCLHITNSSIISINIGKSYCVTMSCLLEYFYFIMCVCYWSIQFSLNLYLVSFKTFLWITLNILLSWKYFYGFFRIVV